MHILKFQVHKYTNITLRLGEACGSCVYRLYIALTRTLHQNRILNYQKPSDEYYNEPNYTQTNLINLLNKINTILEVGSLGSNTTL